MQHVHPTARHFSSGFHFSQFSKAISKKPRNERKNFPPQVRQILKKWLIDHGNHPYPTEAEKQQLCEATSMTKKQIKNWFSNQRKVSASCLPLSRESGNLFTPTIRINPKNTRGSYCKFDLTWKTVRSLINRVSWQPQALCRIVSFLAHLRRTSPRFIPKVLIWDSFQMIDHWVKTTQ